MTPSSHPSCYVTSSLAPDLPSSVNIGPGHMKASRRFSDSFGSATTPRHTADLCSATRDVMARSLAFGTLRARVQIPAPRLKFGRLAAPRSRRGARDLRKRIRHVAEISVRGHGVVDAEARGTAAGRHV